MDDPNKTPLNLPDITQPNSLMKGIDQLERTQTRDSMHGLLADFGYSQDETLDYKRETSAMLELEGAVVILSLTDDKRYRLQTLLEPGMIDTADGLLTLRARITLTPVGHYSRRIQNAYLNIRSAKKVRSAHDAVARHRRAEHRNDMRRLLGGGEKSEAGDLPSS